MAKNNIKSNFNKNLISNITSILDKSVYEKQPLNTQEITKILYNITSELRRLDMESKENINKTILTMIINFSNDFDDFKNKIDKFDSINSPTNKNLKKYFKNEFNFNLEI
jgi:hypothetical protein